MAIGRLFDFLQLGFLRARSQVSSLAPGSDQVSLSPSSPSVQFISVQVLSLSLSLSAQAFSAQAFSALGLSLPKVSQSLSLLKVTLSQIFPATNSNLILLLIKVILLSHLIQDPTALPTLPLLRIKIRQHHPLSLSLLLLRQLQTKRRLELFLRRGCSSNNLAHDLVAHIRRDQIKQSDELGFDAAVRQTRRRRLVIGWAGGAQEEDLVLCAARLAPELGVEHDAARVVGSERLDDAFGALEQPVRGRGQAA